MDFFLIFIGLCVCMIALLSGWLFTDSAMTMPHLADRHDQRRDYFANARFHENRRMRSRCESRAARLLALTIDNPPIKSAYAREITSLLRTVNQAVQDNIARQKNMVNAIGQTHPEAIESSMASLDDSEADQAMLQTLELRLANCQATQRMVEDLHASNKIVINGLQRCITNLTTTRPSELNLAQLQTAIRELRALADSAHRYSSEAVTDESIELDFPSEKKKKRPTVKIATGP